MIRGVANRGYWRKLRIKFRNLLFTIHQIIASHQSFYHKITMLIAKIGRCKRSKLFLSSGIRLNKKLVKTRTRDTKKDHYHNEIHFGPSQANTSFSFIIFSGMGWIIKEYIVLN